MWISRCRFALLLICLVPWGLRGIVTGNLLTNPGAETGDLTGWTSAGPGVPQVDNGSFDPGINPHSGKWDFVGYNGASSSLSQTQSILVQGITAALIDGGTLMANISFWEQGLSQGSPSDDAAVQLTFLDGSGKVIGTQTSPVIDSHNGMWQNYTASYLIPAGTRTITYAMLFFRNAGSDLDAFIDDNSLTIGTPLTVITPSPASLNFTGVEGTSLPPQSIQLTGPAGALWQATAATVSGGNWLIVSPSAGQIPASLTALVDTTNLTAGTYQGSIAFQAPGSSPPITTVMLVSVMLAAAPAGQLTLAPASLSVQGTAGSSNAPAPTIVIGNSGSGTLNWAAAASTVNGGSWLSVSPATGSAGLRTPSSARVSLNLQGLQPGLYTGQIAISPGPLTLPVQLLVSPAGPSLMLGQSGILFNIQQGATAAPPSLSLVNAGGGTLNWQVSQASGGLFSVSPSSGSNAGATQGPSVFSLTPNTAGLNPGSYYGLLQVSAPGAANSPQYVIAVLNVLAPNATAPGRVAPQGLLFVASAGGVAPPSQTVSVSTGSSASVTAAVSTSTQNGGMWLSATPASQSLAPSGTITVSATSGTLAPGVYQGTVTVVFGNGAPSQDIGVYLVVPPASTVQPETAAAACTATSLIMAIQQLGNGFLSPVGWPVNLQAQVIDNCGNAAASATVVASFSNGDPPLTLIGIGNGIYTATWKPGGTASTTTVIVRAFQSPLASAKVTLAGQVAANASPPPFVAPGGVVNGASFASGADVAPGAIVSVFGTNLGASNGNQAGFPLPTTLAGVKLTIGGIDAPLFYAGVGQVNAQVPFEVTPGSQPQMVARVISSSGVETDAVPEPISIGAAHPGIFLAPEPSAPNQGAILDAASTLVDPSNPASAGSVIVIFATGLGATTPPAVTGQAAGPGKVNAPVSVTIGGVAIPGANVQYGGPAPSYVGLYQINVALPSGIPPGATVPVVITQNGVASNAATIAVR